MRILFTTQSSSLRMFDALRISLQGKVQVDRCGFIVSDSKAYLDWLKDHSEFETQGHLLLKEWEVTSQKEGTPDLELIRHYEQILGAPPGLFGAIVTDRRLFMGKDCGYTQDYRRRFTDNELLCILQSCLKKVDRMFDALKPDLVLGFICVTIFDYLIYLFAKARGVRFLNLRPTRLADRVFFGSLLNDPTPEFMESYTHCLQNGSRYDDTARAYLQRVRNQHGMYEGVVKPSARPAKRIRWHPRSLFSSARRFLRNYRGYKTGMVRNDNHVPNVVRSLFFASVVNPWRAWFVDKRLKNQYVTRQELAPRRYAFFPLHTEPEVSLLVYSRPFVNQIEVIRALAMSLPADMILVVKEHPWMVGKRPLSGYRKILNIPRVRLARPDMEARALAEAAALVAVLTSSVGLESTMMKRPVITIGDCPYNALPRTMVSHCPDLRRLPQAIRELLQNHSHDERSLEAYLAASYEISEGINLYSVLLGREGVHAERRADFDAEIEKLADYTLSRLSVAEEDEKVPHKFAAAW